MKFDHRTGDPCNVFAYDNLDRLTIAEYGVTDNNEVFVYNDLGNRDLVNLKAGSDEDYVIDANNNRYVTIDSNALEYDNAGNLTKDKNGYEYTYDYENRLIEVNDVNGTRVADFTYDTAGRRIRKIDSAASATTLYYYNNNWQVLAEYSPGAPPVLQRSYIYGNYIDEVLVMDVNDTGDYYYLHDHLYSPAALTDSNGTVAERYGFFGFLL